MKIKSNISCTPSYKCTSKYLFRFDSSSLMMFSPALAHTNAFLAKSGFSALSGIYPSQRATSGLVNRPTRRDKAAMSWVFASPVTSFSKTDLPLFR